ncbi:PRC-barrel domain protein [Roseiarcus fermentans]|uniref:PRC-barrel domain protein n=1 Tax=Roseiarcus fermentans TaxID=1473586 RepID=A0A366EYE1_9HYPH|nr:PRC-barrel domain-containing protein [Roseiarcus fermentans]RBP07413.1 PRC-barrel domain protein [Roseiarcus fermentans]
MSSFRLTTTPVEPRIAAVSTLLASALAVAWLLGRAAAGAPEPAPVSANPAPPFHARQRATEWRAPRLIGVEVDGLDGRPVGRVEDLLMTHDGVIETVVIGVGGFLGFGTKPVAVPFAALAFRMDARPATLIDEPLGGGAAPADGKPSCAATAEAVRGRPDRVALPATAAQLRSAPSFAYARAAGPAVAAAPGDAASAAPYQ